MTTPSDSAIRWLCRLVIVLPIVVQGGILALGLVPMPWHVFRMASPLSDQQFLVAFGYSMLCSASTIPLIVVAWKFRDPSARGTGGDFGLWSGIKRVLWYAIGRIPKDTAPTKHVSEVTHRKALAFGIAVALFFPTFFLGLGPLPPTLPIIVWIVGAGIIAGANTYVDRRASPYVINRANRFDPFWGIRMMNSDRYDPAGHEFVRWKMILGMLMPIWWIGGGIWAIGFGAPLDKL